MPLFSVLERNPQAPPTPRQYGYDIFILHSGGRKGSPSGQQGDWFSHHLGAQEMVWGALCPPTTRRLASSVSHAHCLFCSPGQKEFLLWPLGDSLRAFVLLALIGQNLFWYLLAGKRKSREREGEGKGKHGGGRERKRMMRKRCKIWG